jgi:serine/threonine protein kinase
MARPSLPPGTRFGPYEVVGVLGAGGMGEVYRAHDSRLGRDVALKVLPTAIAADPERLARFDREARALAALNHPNIGAIYGIEEGNGQPALVLELVEGPTLHEAIRSAFARQNRRAGIAEADALAIAGQIAEALEAAHDRGIVHRDLKPVNIKIAAHNIVKILDFGLAKADRPGALSGDDETKTELATERGLALGTPGYMSPEQSSGEPTGPQTDIWAFGCVLFEMLTGRPTFEGTSATEVLRAVFSVDPDWQLLPPTTSPLVRRLLGRCLQKDRRERPRHIGDVWLDVAEARRPQATAPVVTTTVRETNVDFRRLTESAGLKSHPAISPDGKMVAFTAVSHGKRQIWIQLVAGGAALQLTRDKVDHDEPRWSPDSSRLIYFTPGKQANDSGSIWEISALGGNPRRVTSALENGDISHDGRRLALVRRTAAGVELAVMAFDGSTDHVVTPLDPTYAHSCVRWSPDDQTLATQRSRFTEFETRVLLAPASGGEVITIARADWIRGLAWRPDGRALVYSASTGSTMPYPPTHNLRMVDRDGGHDSPLTFGDASYLEPDVQHGGQIVASRARSRSDVWLFPAFGTPAENVKNAVRVTRQTGHVQTPSMSPSGEEFVFVSDQGGHSNLWISAVDGSDLRQLTFERDPDTVIGIAQWSPRGDLIAFIAAKAGRLGLGLVAPDGSGQRLLVAGFAASWSADGQWLYFTRADGQIYKVNVDDGSERVVRQGAAPSVSRDGRGLVYVARAEKTDGPLNSPVTHITDWQVLRAEPEDGPATPIATIGQHRMPFSQRFVPMLHESPDGQWLALPLADGETSNIWRLPAASGPMVPVTDFGDRATLITRWVCWTPDGQHIAAAVAETDVDIVLLGGLI